MVRNSLVFLPSKAVVQSQEREFLNPFIHFPFTAALPFFLLLQPLGFLCQK